MTIERKHVGPRMSQVAIYGNTVFLAGITAEQRGGTSVAEQTAEILARIDTLLAEAGSSKEQVYRATIWLRDIAAFDEMNSVWDKWVVPGHTPVRATVEARLAMPDVLVEIQVEAAKA
jgi:enamine deaminase RidA (YjgF/YER057c/UK114 family)